MPLPLVDAMWMLGSRLKAEYEGGWNGEISSFVA
jgi:hypothetical protein